MSHEEKTAANQARLRQEIAGLHLELEEAILVDEIKWRDIYDMIDQCNTERDNIQTEIKQLQKEIDDLQKYIKLHSKKGGGSGRTKTTKSHKHARNRAQEKALRAQRSRKITHKPQ